MGAILAAVVLSGLQDPPTSPHYEHLKRLEFLIGEWEGKAEMPGFGLGSLDVEFTLEWTLNKNFIKNRYVAKSKGKVVWTDEGMYGWDADKKRLVNFQFGMDGTIGWGDFGEGEGEEKDTIILEGQTAGPGGKEIFRAKIKKLENGRWSFTIEVRQGEKYVPYGTSVFEKRKK